MCVNSELHIVHFFYGVRLPGGEVTLLQDTGDWDSRRYAFGLKQIIILVSGYPAKFPSVIIHYLYSPK